MNQGAGPTLGKLISDLCFLPRLASQWVLSFPLLYFEAPQAAFPRLGAPMRTARRGCVQRKAEVLTVLASPFDAIPTGSSARMKVHLWFSQSSAFSNVLSPCQACETCRTISRMPKGCVEVRERAGSPEEALWAGRGACCCAPYGRKWMGLRASQLMPTGQVEAEGLAFLIPFPVPGKF